MADFQDYAIGTGGVSALTDAKPADWSPNILADGDATTGGVGSFVRARNAGTVVWDVRKAGAMAIAGLLAIGSASFASSAPALKANSTALEVRLADDSALTNLTAKGVTLTGGTVTTNAPLLSMTQTWNASGVTFKGLEISITNTASAAASRVLDISVGGTSQFSVSTGGIVSTQGSGVFAFGTSAYLIRPTGANMGVGSSTSAAVAMMGANGFRGCNNLGYNWTDHASNVSAGTVDLQITRAASAIVGLLGVTTAGAAIQLTEMTAPSAGATNTVRIYAVDNGGKTQLMALFATGAAQQLAIEP